MKVDETLESVGHVWRQVTILIILHLILSVWAIAAGIVHLKNLETLLGDAQRFGFWPVLSRLHATLEGIGLGLPVVTGIVCVVYMVAFQRLSVALGRIPVFRLIYSQPELWREGLCFDQLRKLIHQFDGYTASSALEDIEVTLGLAIAQYSKSFKEHYERQVALTAAKAELWTTYYSGLSLLLICSLPVVIAGHGWKRALLLPLGLLFSMLVTRCCWEAVTERLILARLQFAIDCAVISQAEAVGEEKRRTTGREGTEVERTSIFSSIATDNYLWNGWYSFLLGNQARATQAVSILYEDVDLAIALMRQLGRRKLWILRFFRKTLRVRIGILASVSDEQFRDWILWRLEQPAVAELLSRVRRDPDFGLLNELQEWKLKAKNYEFVEPGSLLIKGLERPAFEGDDRMSVSLKGWLKRRAKGDLNRQVGPD